MTPLTLAEVATQLRCSAWSAARLVRSGQIKASKVAGKWLVQPGDLSAFVESASNHATSARRRRKRTAA